jgi:hypothetical protein
MTAPSLIHVGLMNAAAQDADASGAKHRHPPSRGGPPRRRARGAVAAVLARAATRFDAETARRAIA